MTDLVELSEAREICPTTTRKALAAGALLVDVREAAEVAAVGFADCEVLHIPLSELEARWAEIPRDRDVVLACAAGIRSLKATYFLMYHGYDRVSNMAHGLTRWIARGFPVTGEASALSESTPSGCGCGDDATVNGGSCRGDAPPDQVSRCCAT
jgi:rhodanese-related sulfurtransferase